MESNQVRVEVSSSVQGTYPTLEDFTAFLHIDPKGKKIEISGYDAQTRYRHFPSLVFTLPWLMIAGELGKQTLRVVGDLLIKFWRDDTKPCEHRTVLLYDAYDRPAIYKECDFKHSADQRK